MTATVSVLARSSDQVEQFLTDIALGPMKPDKRVIVAMLASPEHTSESLAEAWGEFQRQVRDREDLALGIRTWQEFYDPEVCGNQEHAVELKCAEAHEAFRALANWRPA